MAKSVLKLFSRLRSARHKNKLLIYSKNMDPEEIKQKLKEEIAKTKELIKEYKELTKPVAPDVAIGRISRMDAINNKSVTEATLRQAETKLQNLKRVLSMYGTHEFGRCLKCKRQIPAGRILFRPESLYCVNCAT